MKKNLLLLGMVFLSSLCFAQVSKQNAIEIVMDSVVGSDSTNVNVYMEPLLQSNTYYMMSPFDSIQSPYANYWLFFIDDMPSYMWCHACRFVFVNSTNGRFLSVSKQKPPTRLFKYYEDVSLSPRFDFAPITNLSANYHNDSILLTWDFPSTYQPERESLSWSGDMVSQSGSYLQPDIYEDNAHRYDSLDLRSFVGWKIKSIGIIPVDSHVIYYASVWVNEGQEFVQIYQDPLVDTVLFEENLHELNQSIIIEAGKEYLIGYRVLCDPSLPYWSGYYNAIDAGPGNGKGNMNNNYFLGWEPYPPMYNWCINTIIESPEGEVLTLSQKNEETLTGYRVYKDGQLMEEIGRRFQTYYIDHGFAIGETVTYSVTAMYGEMESEPVNISFTYDGLAESQAMISVVVFPNPTNDLVRIEDVTVADVQVYNALGQLVKTVQNLNEIDMGALSEGVYLLRITSTDGHVHIGKVALGK